MPEEKFWYSLNAEENHIEIKRYTDPPTSALPAIRRRPFY
jgi:hypothetical protein